MGLGVVGVYFNGLINTGEGAWGVPQLLQGVGAVYMESRVGRLEFDSAVTVGDGSLKLMQIK